MAAHNQARATRNRTIDLDNSERSKLRERLGSIDEIRSARNEVICADADTALPKLAPESFDLLFADPPYNLTKSFGKSSFRRKPLEAYEQWLEGWIKLAVPLLKNDASVYICGDWRSAAAIQRIGAKYLRLRNRITWEREKGRGSKRNWKNAKWHNHRNARDQICTLYQTI